MNLSNMCKCSNRSKIIFRGGRGGSNTHIRTHTHTYAHFTVALFVLLDVYLIIENG